MNRCAVRNRRRRWCDEQGQATVELVALLPIVVAVVLAVATWLAGQQAREAADQAAVAAAIAQVQGSDPMAAVRQAAPGWTRPTLRVSGGRVRVRLRWKLPRPLTDLVDVDQTVAYTPMGRPR